MRIESELRTPGQKEMLQKNRTNAGIAQLHSLHYSVNKIMTHSLVSPSFFILGTHLIYKDKFINLFTIIN